MNDNIMQKDFINFVRTTLEGNFLSKAAVDFNIYGVVLLEFNDKQSNVYSLMVYSSWRLIHEQKIIHSSNFLDEMTIPKANDFFTRGLPNKEVDRVEISDFFDIRLTFKNDFLFHVFCDKDIYHSISPNWVFGINNTYWGVNNLFSVYVEENGIKRRAGNNDFPPTYIKER